VIIHRRALSLFALLLFASLGVMLLRGILAIEHSSSVSGPAAHYLANTRDETGARNVVAAILFDYRAFDTLGESTVIFTTVCGVAMLFSRRKFHRSCVRQRISRAIDSKLILKTGEKESDLDTFYRLHIKTRKRLSLPPQPYAFFKSIWKTFSPTQKLTLLIAEKDGKALASLILFKFRDRVSAEFAASDETFRDLSPNHFLFWEAIKNAYEGGYRIFDFGRTSPDNKSLMDFKRHWGTTVIDLPQYYYPKHSAENLSNEEESLSYRLVKKLCEKAPDYALKQIGNLCYRHLG